MQRESLKANLKILSHFKASEMAKSQELPGRPWTRTRALPWTRWGAHSAPRPPAVFGNDLRSLHLGPLSLNFPVNNWHSSPPLSLAVTNSSHFNLYSLSCIKRGGHLKRGRLKGWVLIVRGF